MIERYLDTDGLSLRNSFRAELTNAWIHIMFAQKASDIIRKKQETLHSIGDWDENERLRIKEFNKNIECGVQVTSILEDLYKKEFDDFEDVEQYAKAVAERATEHMLDTFGWRKETAK